jgi:hypothetical protein
MQLILLNLKQWVGRQQRLRRPEVSASRQIQRRRNRRKLGNVRRYSV